MYKHDIFSLADGSFNYSFLQLDHYEKFVAFKLFKLFKLFIDIMNSAHFAQKVKVDAVSQETEIIILAFQS